MGAFDHKMSEPRRFIRLNRRQIQLLKELAVAGQHGRTIAALASSIETAHLIGALYIRRLPVTKLYVITERGQRALVDATAEGLHQI